MSQSTIDAILGALVLLLAVAVFVIHPIGRYIVQRRRAARKARLSYRIQMTDSEVERKFAAIREAARL